MTQQGGKSGNERVYRGRDFCREFFPKAHALKTCGCYRQERRGVFVIQPRSGPSIRVLR